MTADYIRHAEATGGISAISYSEKQDWIDFRNNRIDEINLSVVTAKGDYSELEGLYKSGQKSEYARELRNVANDETCEKFGFDALNLN